jgi:hypothetical protein
MPAMRRTALLLALVAVALTATPAQAEHAKGKYFLPNKSESRKMPVKRGKRFVKKVVRLNYDVRKGSDIYACSRHELDEVGCDFAFRSKAGVYTCGNAIANANPRRIKVRYESDTGGCGDF